MQENIKRVAAALSTGFKALEELKYSNYGFVGSALNREVDDDYAPFKSRSEKFSHIVLKALTSCETVAGVSKLKRLELCEYLL